MIYRVTVTCEECGHRMLLERYRTDGETVYLICHECEALLAVQVEIPAEVGVRG